MTGSTMALIVIPIVNAIGLAAWLAMVFYADAHPQHRSRTAKPAKEIPEQTAQRRKAA